jgi:hypothetical protein
VTLAATAASTYALDAVATAAGVALVASGVVSGVERGLLLALLAGSYVAWAAGLRVSVGANWALLEETGTSTNAVSKAAYELARLRTGSARVRRIAASSGYVAVEVAKEAPYYAGAFGAALLSETVSSHEAIVFLAGANVGAAGYEYGLGRLTQAFLRRRKREPVTPELAAAALPAYASFENDWVPRDYLTDYYGVVEPDELHTIGFFVDAMEHVARGEPILFYGVGPTLHHVFLAAPAASEIHLAEYLPANLREIERWLERDPDAHDWRPFVRYTLECEGVACPTEAQVAEREQLTRAKITKLLRADARLPDALVEHDGRRYGTVISAYCADSATDDRATWAMYMARIAGLVRPGGVFVTAALRRSSVYLVGGKPFPSANVDEDDVRAVLERELGGTDGAVEARALPEHESQGYSGIVLAWARRRTQAAH